MKVEDKVYVIGRGNIICSTLGDNDVIRKSDKIKINNNIFDIVGIEMLAYSKHIGLIFRPNNLVEEVNINDEIEILKDELV